MIPYHWIHWIAYIFWYFKANEVEEGDPGDQGAERAGEAGPGSQGAGHCAGAVRPARQRLTKPNRSCACAAPVSTALSSQQRTVIVHETCEEKRLRAQWEKNVTNT